MVPFLDMTTILQKEVESEVLAAVSFMDEEDKKMVGAGLAECHHLVEYHSYFWKV